MLFSAGILVAVWLFSRPKREAGDFNRVVIIVLGSYLSLRYSYAEDGGVVDVPDHVRTAYEKLITRGLVKPEGKRK